MSHIPDPIIDGVICSQREFSHDMTEFKARKMMLLAEITLDRNYRSIRTTALELQIWY